jgi:uncharacterized protein YdbL (DUF1318 family)
MKTRFLTLFTLFGLIMAFPAIALDLQSARTSGLVGETRDGYVAAVVSRPDVQALVDEINAKRRAEYARISKENGQSVDVVAKLASEQIINRLDSGAYYKGPDGSWKRR